MIQSELFETIRELCESALYFYSIQKVGQAHRLLDKCEQILATHGYLDLGAPMLRASGDEGEGRGTFRDAFVN